MATFRKRGDSWHAQVRRAGASSLTKSFKSKADAQEWARKVEYDIYVGQLPERRTGQSLKLTEVLARYLAEVTSLKRGAVSETYRIQCMQRSWLGEKTLGSLTARDILRYRNERLSEVSSGSVRRELVILYHCLTYAHREWKLVVSDLVLKMDLPKDSSPRERRLSAGELDALKAAARKSRNAFILPMVLLAHQTGLRRSELLAATWDAVDLSKRSMVIPMSKNGHSRIIPLTKLAVGLLEKLPRTGERVFPMTESAFKQAWERLVVRAGIKDLHFHDLRHEAISGFFELGLSVPEVALISGHRDMRMLFRYTHPARQRILDRFDGASPN